MTLTFKASAILIKVPIVTLILPFSIWIKADLSMLHMRPSSFEVRFCDFLILVIAAPISFKVFVFIRRNFHRISTILTLFKVRYITPVRFLITFNQLKTI